MTITSRLFPSWRICHWVVVLLSLFLSHVLIGCGNEKTASKQDQDAIKKVWADYQEAKRTRNGEAVVRHYSSETIRYWDRIAALASAGPKSEFDAAPMSQGFIALRSRYDFGRDKLNGMSGRDLIALQQTLPTS